MGTGRGCREQHIRIFLRIVMRPWRANTYGLTFFKAVYKNGTYLSLDICKMLCGSIQKATNVL